MADGIPLSVPLRSSLTYRAASTQRLVCRLVLTLPGAATSISAWVLGVTGESNTIRIGDGLNFVAGAQCFIGGILTNFIPLAPGNPLVTINTTTGQLGWTTDYAAAKVEEQQKKIEEQQASINQMKSEMQTMVAQLKENAVQIQRANTQLEMSNPVTKVVANKR